MSSLPPPPRPRRVSALVLILCAAALLIVGVHQVHRRHQVVRLGYELSEATARLRVLEEEKRRLSLEASVLTNPARIERLARGLGLERPAPGQTRDARQGALARAEARR